MQNSGKTLKYSDKIEVNLFYFQCLHVVLTTSPNEIIGNLNKKGNLMIIIV